MNGQDAETLAAQSFTSVTAQMSAAVTSGAFTRTLLSLSASMNVSALMNVYANIVPSFSAYVLTYIKTISPTAGPTLQSSKASRRYSDGELAAIIVVPSIVFMIIVTILCTYVWKKFYTSTNKDSFRQRPASSAPPMLLDIYQSNPTDDASIHESSPLKATSMPSPSSALRPSSTSPKSSTSLPSPTSSSTLASGGKGTGRLNQLLLRQDRDSPKRLLRLEALHKNYLNVNSLTPTHKQSYAYIQTDKLSNTYMNSGIDTNPSAISAVAASSPLLSPSNKPPVISPVKRVSIVIDVDGDLSLSAASRPKVMDIDMDEGMDKGIDIDTDSDINIDLDSSVEGNCDGDFDGALQARLDSLLLIPPSVTFPTSGSVGNAENQSMHVCEDKDGGEVEANWWDLM